MGTNECYSTAVFMENNLADGTRGDVDTHTTSSRIHQQQEVKSAFIAATETKHCYAAPSVNPGQLHAEHKTTDTSQEPKTEYGYVIPWTSTSTPTLEV